MVGYKKKKMMVFFAGIMLLVASVSTQADEVNADHNYTLTFQNSLDQVYVLDVDNKKDKTNKCFENFNPSMHFDVNKNQSTLSFKVKEYKMNYCNTTKHVFIHLTPKNGGVTYTVTFEKQLGSSPTLASSDLTHVVIQGLNVQIK